MRRETVGMATLAFFYQVWLSEDHGESQPWHDFVILPSFRANISVTLTAIRSLRCYSLVDRLERAIL